MTRAAEVMQRRTVFECVDPKCSKKKSLRLVSRTEDGYVWDMRPLESAPDNWPECCGYRMREVVAPDSTV